MWSQITTDEWRGGHFSIYVPSQQLEETVVTLDPDLLEDL